jgi:hypothetical protein
MDYKYWSRLLSPDEFKNWEVEVLMFVAFSRGRNDFFEREYATWKDFINSSFSWSNTKQGSDYWMDIFDDERWFIGS